MIWKVNTHTCKYFLAILKKFYEILETLVKLQSNRHKRPRTNPCSHTTALCIHFGYCLRDSGCSFYHRQIALHFTRTQYSHTHTFIRTHHLRTIEREREEKAITRTLTHMQTHILSHSRSLIRTHVRKFKR